MTTRKRPPWIRFTIASLLFLAFLAAGAFVGFQYGLSAGVDAQVESRLADQQSIVYPKIYRVTKFVAGADNHQIPPSALDQLISEIEDSVGHRRWKKDDGPCTIAAMAPNSILISGSSSDHEQVMAYLKGRQTGLNENLAR